MLSTASGVLVPEDVMKHDNDLAKDPEFDRNFSQLLDSTHITKLELTATDVKRFAATDLFAPHARRAIIVKDNLCYGFARMFEILREGKGDSGIAVFKELEDGLEWIFPEHPRRTEK